MTAPTVTDDQADVMAAVKRRRDAVHRTIAAALLPILGNLASQLDPISLRLAVDPDADLAARKAQATADLTRQARIVGVIPAWTQANQDAQTTAVAAGAAAVGHVATLGALPIEPDDEIPTSSSGYIAGGRVLDQLSGVGADAVRALADEELTDEELIDALADSPGALYYADLMTAQDFIDGSASTWAAIGVDSFAWDTMEDDRVCQDCDEYEARSPYAFADIPAVPHGLCRCWVMPY